MRIKKALYGLGIMLFSFAISSCGNKTTTTNEETNKSDEFKVKDYKDIKIDSPDFTVRRINKKEDVTYQDLFNLGNQVTISLDMEISELEKLQKDYEKFKESGYKEEIYRHCKCVTITLKNYDNTFTWEYEDVGIRQKGNTSRGNVFLEGKIVNANHYKLSFDETFDEEYYFEDKENWEGKDFEYEERKNREFLGLSGLDLRANKQKDSSYIREIYASYMYQSLGLIAQHVGLASFNILEEDTNILYNMGLYKIYEPATKSMIKRHLKDNNILNFGTWNEEKNGTFGASNSNYGDLYKGAWGAALSMDSMYGNLIDVKDPILMNKPVYERKTNKDIDYDDSLLRNAGLAVSYGNYKDISKYIDLEYFAATEAVSFLAGNPDDFRNNMNNTMFYARRSDGKVITIPIDNDRVFGQTNNWNPDGSGCASREIFDIYRAGDSPNMVSEIYLKTILAEKNNPYKQMYLNYIKAIYLSKWLNEETFNQYYLIAKNTYNDLVKSSFSYVDFNNDYDSNNDFTFKTYINRKKTMVDLDYELGEIETLKETTLPTLESFNGYYGKLYIAGDMNGWRGTAYEMEYLGEGRYTITFNPNVPSGNLYLKIYDGNYWRVNWSIQYGKLIMRDTDAICVRNLKTNNTITITINTITMEASVTKN